MNRHQVSLSRLMLMIAFAAIDVLIARWALSRDDAARAIACQFALIVPAAQLGADRALHGHPRFRPFWIGFMASGLLTALSYWPGLRPLGRLGTDALWEGYVNGGSRLLWQSPELRFLYSSRAWHFAAGALMFFLPQAILGWAGGALAMVLIRRQPGHAPCSGVAD